MSELVLSYRQWIVQTRYHPDVDTRQMKCHLCNRELNIKEFGERWNKEFFMDNRVHFYSSFKDVPIHLEPKTVPVCTPCKVSVILGEFGCLGAVAIASNGNIAVSEIANARIQVLHQVPSSWKCLYIVVCDTRNHNSNH